MAEIKKLYTIASLPGIKRDGTTLDGDNYADGQWCRFQRGRPKKMGGFMRITNQFSGPIRSVLVWSRESLNAIYSFSPYGVEMLLVDANGTGSQIIDRSPSGWTTKDAVVWSVATQYDDAVGTVGTVVLAHANDAMVNIDSTTATKPYLGLANANTALTQIADAPAVSGGIFSVAPYTIVHGSDGFVAWSDANQPTVWYTSSGNIGDAGADRVTGAKIVRGLALRSGSGPAALLWSLDSVIRMDYVGGVVIFKFTHLSTQSSILSQNGVIEYDGMYYWVGVDRFMMCDGSTVRELPNDMNLNWFFDNLNYYQRQKVWAMKVPRYGEIWWFFPVGEDEECSRAVIYNVREKTWYDTESLRSAGFYSQVFRYPVMSGVFPTLTEFVFTLTGVSGDFAVGDIVTGVNGARASVTYVNGTTIRIHLLDSLNFVVGALGNLTSVGQVLTVSSVTGTVSVGDFIEHDSTDAQGVVVAVSIAAGAGTLTVRLTGNYTAFTAGAFTDTTSTAAGTIDSVTAATSASATVATIRYLYSVFSHERGTDAIDGDVVQPIESYFTTADFGFPTGGAQPNQLEGLNRWTRLVRVEPDFVQYGEMSLTVLGKEFANAPETASTGYNFTSDTLRIDMREQRREVRLKFSSNTVGGHYEMGRPILHLEPGDVRS